MFVEINESCLRINFLSNVRAVLNYAKIPMNLFFHVSRWKILQFDE